MQLGSWRKHGAVRVINVKPSWEVSEFQSPIGNRKFLGSGIICEFRGARASRVLAMVSSPSQTSLRSFTTEVTETTKPFQVSEIGNHKSEWSEWDERHGRQCREGSGRVRREVPRYKSSIRPAVLKHRRPVGPLILVSHVPEL